MSFSRNPTAEKGVICTLPQKVGPVTSPHEAEYKALIAGLELATGEKLPYIAVFSDSATLVNQITRGWDKNERLAELCAQAEALLRDFKMWQLSWIPREMNKEADKLVDRAFKGQPVEHAVE